ncbi:hypothetical protein [Neobacillus terrae]|uniref:hypothetical protein n=1 Tax=Neobacillus terrae TaxID=3034837 RepID=UPI00140C710B|nr:hypothetical protein [Neobacillus terrae]NHM29998.1 hypothetical protein [Neobacillus terrae]
MNSAAKYMYHYHLFLHRYNNALVKGALCEKLKAKLKAKSSYHLEKAVGLLYLTQLTGIK